MPKFGKRQGITDVKCRDSANVPTNDGRLSQPEQTARQTTGNIVTTCTTQSISSLPRRTSSVWHSRFAFLANYVFFCGLLRLFSDGDSEEETLPAIEHIEAPDVRRLYPKDSINLLKYYDYVPIQKKDSLRYEHLA